MQTGSAKKVPLVPFVERQPLGFEVTRVSTIIANAAPDHDPTRTHRIDFCGLIYVDRGAGVHTIESVDHAIERGDLVFIANDRMQRFSERGDYDGVLILFTEDFLFRKASLSNAVLLNLLYPLTEIPPVIKSDRRLHRSIELLGDEWNDANPFERADILRVLLDYLLLQICRLRNAAPVAAHASKHAALFSRFFALIRNCFRETRSAAEYAGKLQLSYKHLNTICKAVCGLTAREAIDRYVLLEAKRLLATGDDSVEELAASLGFDEATNFIKYFKRHSGATPAQFRRSLERNERRRH